MGGAALGDEHDDHAADHAPMTRPPSSATGPNHGFQRLRGRVTAARARPATRSRATPGGGRRAAAAVAARPPSIPARSAPSTSSSRLSPTWIASPAPTPASASAAAKSRASGLATPTSAEVTTPSSSSSSPVRSSTSCSETSQLLATTSAKPSRAGARAPPAPPGRRGSGCCRAASARAPRASSAASGPQLAAEHRRALEPQRGERAASAARDAVRAVVGHLGAQRPRRVGARHLDPVALAQQRERAAAAGGSSATSVPSASSRMARGGMRGDHRRGALHACLHRRPTGPPGASGVRESAGARPDAPERPRNDRP